MFIYSHQNNEEDEDGNQRDDINEIDDYKNASEHEEEDEDYDDAEEREGDNHDEENLENSDNNEDDDAARNEVSGAIQDSESSKIKGKGIMKEVTKKVDKKERNKINDVTGDEKRRRKGILNFNALRIN